MIRQFNILNNDYKFVDTNDSYDFIPGLKKCNIFIGPNNSGKSRFVRDVLKLDYTSQIPRSLDQKEIDRHVEIFKNFYENKNIADQAPLSNLATFLKQHLDENLEEARFNYEKYVYMYNEIVKYAEQMVQNGTRQVNHGGPYSGRHDQVIQQHFINPILSAINVSPSALNPYKGYKKVYIPMLRGLRPIEFADENEMQGSPFQDGDLYMNRTVFDYYTKKEKNGSYEKDFIEIFNRDAGFEVFTGLSVYREITRMLLGTQDQRDFVRRFERFLSENFFGIDITLTPNIDDDVLYITTKNEKDRAIYDLGDGLQSIIIATFPIFKYRDTGLVLVIEEPEMTMHPGMQRKLIEALMISGEAKFVQLYLTTHSNHFLDLAYDYSDKVNIFTVEKREKDFAVRNLSDNKAVLDLLGIKNSSVFLANSVIWVEGISDWTLLKPMISMYKKSPEFKRKGLNNYDEDKHYAFAEYGGGNITHFGFKDAERDERKLNVESLTKNNLVIADADNTEPGSKDEKTLFRQQMKEILGKNFWCKHKEIENLMPAKVWSRYFEKHAGAHRRSWIYDPERMTSDFSEDIEKRRILDVLKKNFIILSETASKKFETRFKRRNSGVGPITPAGGKTIMAQRLAKIMETMMRDDELTFAELPKQSKQLVRAIYTFIEENNSHSKIKL